MLLKYVCLLSLLLYYSFSWGAFATSISVNSESSVILIYKFSHVSLLRKWWYVSNSKTGIDQQPWDFILTYYLNYYLSSYILSQVSCGDI